MYFRCRYSCDNCGSCFSSHSLLRKHINVCELSAINNIVTPLNSTHTVENQLDSLQDDSPMSLMDIRDDSVTHNIDSHLADKQAVIVMSQPMVSHSEMSQSSLMSTVRQSSTISTVSQSSVMSTDVHHYDSSIEKDAQMVLIPVAMANSSYTNTDNAC